MTLSTIEAQELAPEHTAVARLHLSMAETDRIPRALEQTMLAIQQAGQQPAGMPFVRTIAFDGGSMDIEVGWPVAEPFEASGEVTASMLPGGPAAVASYLGPYDQIAPAYEAIQAWCAEHGREIAGPPWESYFTDPHDEPDPAKWRTDLHFPLKP